MKLTSSTPDVAADSSEKAQKSSVQSLAKGLKILEIFTADDEPLTVTEISERAELDPGTAFRMLNTLVALGYVTRSEKRRYALSLKVLDLGFNAIGRRDLRASIRPILRGLVGEKIEAASFGVLEGPNVIYVERVRAGLTRLGVDIRVGSAMPAAINILGQAILAHLPPADLTQALSKDSATAAGYPVVSRARLLPQLKEIKEAGFASDGSLITAGLNVLSVPVCDDEGYPIAAVSVAAPSLICSSELLREDALKRVKAAAADIAKVMQISGTSRFG
jgi:IclR family pca regulon transcriptional regulator